MESSVSGGRRGYQSKPKQKSQHYHLQQQQQLQSQSCCISNTNNNNHCMVGANLKKPPTCAQENFKSYEMAPRTLNARDCRRNRVEETDSNDSYSDDDVPISNRYNTVNGANGNHRYHTIGSPPPMTSTFPHFPPPPDYPPPHREYYIESNDVIRSAGPSAAGHKNSIKASTHRRPTHRIDNTEREQSISNSRSFHDGSGSNRTPGMDQHTIINGAATVRSKMQHLNKMEPQGKWLRHNISATMAHFKPGTALTSKEIPDRRDSSVDAIRRTFDHPHAVAGPSTSTMPTPNSIRALLMTANRNRMLSPSPKHMYTTRYGTQENIYEEITDEERMHLISGHSMLSLNQNTLEEEFRQVQSRHRRILGELNLSVEALLMPVTPPSESPTGEDGESTPNQASCIDELITGAVGPTDELLSPVSAHATLVGDLDSGFSGSSSGGASYVGSLRYRTGLMTRSSTPSGPSSGSMSGSGSCRSSQRSNEDPGILSLSSRSSSLYGSTKVKAAEDPGPAGSKDNKSKTSFWSRKGWKKFPGFSSTSSVNKSGLNNGESNSIFSFDA